MLGSMMQPSLLLLLKLRNDGLGLSRVHLRRGCLSLRPEGRMQPDIQATARAKNLTNRQVIRPDFSLCQDWTHGCTLALLYADHEIGD